MTFNVIELLAVLAAGIGGVVALQAAIRRQDRRLPQRRSHRLGAHIMRQVPHR